MAETIIKGMTHVTTGVGPVFTAGSNSGMFATVVRPGAGDYDITIDPEFPIDPADSVRVVVEGNVALGTSVVRTGVLAITVALINAAAAAADPQAGAGIAIIVEGPDFG